MFLQLEISFRNPTLNASKFDVKLSSRRESQEVDWFGHAMVADACPFGDFCVRCTP
jgi:hypothetical protein